MPAVKWSCVDSLKLLSQRRFRTAATSKTKRFVIIANRWKPLIIITKHSILDVPAVLDPPLYLIRMFVVTEEIYVEKTTVTATSMLH